MSQDLRRAFGQFLTGVTVVTTRDAAGQLHGFTANSFTSVSLDPPLLLVCPGAHLSSYSAFTSAAHFALSILAEGQEDVANRYASRTGTRFEPGECDPDAQGCALIKGRAAGFSCHVTQSIPAGDHTVLIGAVDDFDISAQPGLGYGPNGYFSLAQERRADAATTRAGRVGVLLEHADHLYLGPDHDLPWTTVPPGQGALSALRAALIGQGITADIGPVYSIYNAEDGTRCVVFRATCQSPPNLRPVALSALPNLPDAAVTDMLRRFATEHRARAYGLYVGDAHAGDVFPQTES
ncbi:MAG: flavin reductase family protein [Sedimentitalea sp.]